MKCVCIVAKIINSRLWLALGKLLRLDRYSGVLADFLRDIFEIYKKFISRFRVNYRGANVSSISSLVSSGFSSFITNPFPSSARSCSGDKMSVGVSPWKTPFFRFCLGLFVRGAGHFIFSSVSERTTNEGRMFGSSSQHAFIIVTKAFGICSPIGGRNPFEH